MKVSLIDSYTVICMYVIVVTQARVPHGIVAASVTKLPNRYPGGVKTFPGVKDKFT